jgi:hypothetical protein
VDLTWNANGNMLSKGNVAYTFDAPDRLIQVIDNDSHLSAALVMTPFPSKQSVLSE